MCNCDIVLAEKFPYSADSWTDGFIEIGRQVLHLLLG